MEAQIEKELVRDADLEIQDPAFFRDILKAVKITGDGDLVDFTLDPEGITVKQMDPSHILGVDLFIPDNFFYTYSVYEERKIALDLDTLIRLVFKRGKMKGYYLKAKIQEYHIIFDVFKDTQKTRKTTAILDPHEDRLLPEPKIVYNSRVRIVTKTLKGILEDCKAINAEHVLITVEPDKLLFTAKNQDKGFLAESMFEKYSDDIYELESTGTQKATYDASYLMDLVKVLLKISDTIALEISNDVPIRITAETPVYGLKLIYYLSPCIGYKDKTPDPQEDSDLEEDQELEQAAPHVDTVDIIDPYEDPAPPEDPLEIPGVETDPDPYEDPEPVEIPPVEADPEPHEDQLSPGELYLKYYAEALARHTAEDA